MTAPRCIDRDELAERVGRSLEQAAVLREQTVALVEVEREERRVLHARRAAVRALIAQRHAARRKRERRAAAEARWSRRRGDSDLDTLHRRYAASGDEAARAALIERYTGLARSMALRAARGHQDSDDLMQVAMYGLLRALERFDPARGVAFSTFAHATIDGELKRHRRKTAWSVHVPRRLQEIYLRVAAAVDELSHELGRQATIEEVAERADCEVTEVVEVLEFRDLQRPTSLDQPIADGGRVREIAEDDTGFDSVERADLVAHLLGKLDDREREMVELRFVHNLKQSEIAEKMGMSQMHVSRLLRTTIERLRALAVAR